MKYEGRKRYKTEIPKSDGLEGLIVPCIMAENSEACVGNSCSLYETCWGEKYGTMKGMQGGNDTIYNEKRK